jgi:guanosine-3',5'-bis(diphosphate) 3'-pyrophosphohydrolase
MQRRKDVEASPYINHPLALANILANEGGVTDATVIAAALLHDTVEDTKTTLTELGDVFGPRVMAIVEEVTDDKSLPKEERKRLQISMAASASKDAKLVKIADKIDNLRELASAPPADWGVERRREYLLWSRDVVHALGDVNPELEASFEKAYTAGIISLESDVGAPRRIPSSLED